MKICSKCKINKPLVEFYKRSALRDGHSSICKECSKENHKKHKTDIGYIVNNIYSHQKATSKKRKYSLPNYTKEELKEWLQKQHGLNTLIDNWKHSNFNRWLTPSVDRLDDYKPYTLDNIQLVTWKENKDNFHEAVKEGRNTKNCKAIKQIDINTNRILNEFKSIHIASRELNINRSNISQCLTGKQKTSGGFKWEYV